MTGNLKQAGEKIKNAFLGRGYSSPPAVLVSCFTRQQEKQPAIEPELTQAASMASSAQPVLSPTTGRASSINSTSASNWSRFRTTVPRILRPVRDCARKGWPLAGQRWPPVIVVGVGHYGVAVLDELTERYGDLLAGSYDCVDRIVLNAYFSLGHNPGGFRVWWRRLHGDSDELLDNTHLMRMAGRFARRVRAWATAHQVPVIDCKRGERKHQLAEEYLASHSVGPGVFLILVARASAAVWEVTRSRSGVIVNLAKKMAFVNHYSFHIMDPQWGHVTIKMSGHPPFSAQVILNGHEYVAAAAQAAGIGFTKPNLLDLRGRVWL